MSKAKRNSLLLLIAAGVLTLLLAMSLPNLVLTPGQPFSLEQPQEVPGAAGLAPGGSLLLLVFRGFLALMVIFLPIYVIYSLTNKEGRKRLLGNVLLLVLLLLLADYLERNPLSPGEQEQAAEVAIGQSNNLLGQSDLPPSVFTPNPPTWLTPVIILIASALVMVVVFSVIWYFRQRAKPTDLALERLAETAQDTIDSLQSGGDFEVSVIRCYQEMSRVVKTEKGIARETTMTAREFEDRLVSKGLPQDAVQTLTRLFERVRYGGKAAGSGEIDTALTCLTDIVKACGGHYEVG